jgi:pilus assembly protein Flp/PilA
LQEIADMLALKCFYGDDAGATAVEYALLTSLLAIVLIAVLSNLGTALSGEFSQVSAALK